jgi:hypothetical protein
LPISSHHDRDSQRFDEHTNTRPTGSNYISTNDSDDGIDRRGFLRCMAWAGTGIVWGLKGGIPTSFSVGALSSMTEVQRKSIFFAQISAKNAFKASPVIDTDQRFSTTFSSAGTYDYFCALHPKMQGTVVVTRA